MLAIVLCILLHSTNINAQMNLPQASQKASLFQTVGITDIKMEYHKPSVKGRVIFVDVVPFDSVWRTGANEATMISFSTDVMVEGKPLAAGKYALYTIPGKVEWTIIFNKKKDMSSPFPYNKTMDILRVKVKPLANEMTESMMFHISDVTLNSCTINLEWEKIKVPIKLKTDTDARVMKYLREFIHSEPDDASVYKSAAQYTLMSGLHLEIGIDWIDSAIIYKPDYDCYLIKGNIYGKAGNYEEAIEALNKGLELAKKDKDFDTIKARFEKTISELKSKQGK